MQPSQNEAELARCLPEERALHARAERTNRLKDELLAALGHELRAPLNVILGWSRLLESGRLGTADVRRGGETIARNVRALAQLADDLLDLSGLLSGRIRLDAEETDLGEIVEAALETLQGSADAKSVVLRKHLPALPCRVFGDPHRLQQVVWNMVSNAIKFTPSGGAVTASLSADERNWEVRVADTGIGLAPERLANVFEPFEPYASAGRREYPGLGLGLAIAKQIVELHGGRVWAASPGEGRGTTFHVMLPQVAPRETAGRDGARAPEVRSLDLQGVRVLIVDDEADTLELTRQVLGGHRAVVRTATSVEAALTALAGFHADVLISDLAMPGRDGYELIRSIRESRGPDQLPAVALTAFVRPEDAVRARDAGFQIHLAKPVEPEELLRVVAHLAGR
jgi:CheY-like chemotaxis protein